MLLFKAWLLFLTGLPLITGQSPTDTTFGILQIITPTTQYAQVPASAIANFNADFLAFYVEYLVADTFTFDAAVASIVGALPEASQSAALDSEFLIASVYSNAAISLVDEPTQYITEVAAAASPWPSKFSSQLMSQVSNLLLGAESIASQDILSKHALPAPVTPGASPASVPTITGFSNSTGGPGAATTNASTAGTTGAPNTASGTSPTNQVGKGTVPAGPAATPKSSSSTAAAAASTPDIKLIANAVAGGLALVGVALM